MYKINRNHLLRSCYKVLVHFVSVSYQLNNNKDDNIGMGRGNALVEVLLITNHRWDFQTKVVQ